MSGEQQHPSRVAAGRAAWARLARALHRPSRGAVVAAVLAMLLGVALSTQIQHTREQGLEKLRPDELVGILDTVTQRADRLESERRALETERDRLAAERGGSPEALKAARARVDTLRVWSGTSAARGPGVRITITDPGGKVESANLLDALQELRDAGAEAVQIGTVRAVASTSVTSNGASILVDGAPQRSPYTLIAVGDAQTLASAMRIPGGLVETVRGQGAQIVVQPEKDIVVNALHAPREPRYARAVPAP